MSTPALNKSLCNCSLKKDIIFYIFAFIISFLLYRRDIDGVDTGKLLFVLLAIVYAIISDYSHLMMGTAFLLPLANGLPGNYIFPLLCVIIVVKGWKKLQVNPLVWFAFTLIIISELLHILLFASAPNVSNYIGYCAAIFLLLVVGGSDDEGSDNSKNALAFCIGSVVMLTVILLNFSMMTESQIQDIGIRVGDTSLFGDEDKMTLGTNPNNIGLYSIATISISFSLWFYKKIPLWSFVILAALAFIAGMSSMSRTWMLSLIVFGFFFLLFNKGKSYIPTIIVIVIAVGIYLLFERSGSNAVDMFVERFRGSEINTAGSRTILFAAYHNWMFANEWALIFGTGAQTYKEVTMIYDASHNAFQQIFLAYGIPGLLFFIYLLYRSVKKWRVLNERIVYLPIIVIGFFLQSGQFLNPAYEMYPFIASFFVLKMVKSDSLHNFLL